MIIFVTMFGGAMIGALVASQGIMRHWSLTKVLVLSLLAYGIFLVTFRCIVGG